MTVPIAYPVRKGTPTHISENGRALCGAALHTRVAGYAGPVSHVGCKRCRKMHGEKLMADAVKMWNNRITGEKSEENS